MRLCRQERLGHRLERDTSRDIPEGDGVSLTQYTEVGTANVSREVDTTKSWYLPFDPVGMYVINFRPKGGPVS